MTGNIIGYDLNEKYCQISYYSEEQQEPQTMQTTADNYQIPLVIGKQGETWFFGEDARRLESLEKAYTASNLLAKSLLRERIAFGEESYEAVWLLAKFVELSLEKISDIQQLVFTVPRMSVDIGKILRGIGQRIGVAKNCVCVQDYKESFCNYMFYQPKELWQFESALFHCENNEVRAYMLRKLRKGLGKEQTTFVTVDEVECAKIEELADVYPIRSISLAKEADKRFKTFVQGVFEKKMISSVFLTGDGFEHNWYPLSLKVLCNGRRVFVGNNLYSKGACYAAYQQCADVNDAPVYLDYAKMTEQISMKMRVNGQDEWYPLVPWGNRWYESDDQWEVLVEDVEEVEIHVESLLDSNVQVKKVSMEGIPKRKGYCVRLQIKTLFLDEQTCKISFKDIGFGEFFPATEFYKEIEIKLGGEDEQFDSMS